MIIHNLTTKQQVILTTIWELDTEEKVISFVRSLPYRDMRDVPLLMQLVEAGGDEVPDVEQARQILDKIAKR